MSNWLTWNLGHKWCN